MSAVMHSLRTSRTVAARATRLQHPNGPSASSTPSLVPRRLASQESTGSAASENKENADKARQTKNKAQPKFNTEPAASTPEVEKHNEELEKRKEKSAFQGGGDVAEKVPKGYWSGTSAGNK